MNIFQELSWDKDKELQESTIKYFSNDESFDFNNLIKEAPKESMENLVEIVAKKNVDERYKFIDGLLFLLQDLSWPGAAKAMSLLKSIHKEKLLPYLENKLIEAYEENDDNWLGNLNILVKYHYFTKNDFKNIDLTKVLKKAAW